MESNYGIFPSSENKCAEKVLPPDARSIVEVSKESGINDQTIRNWIKQSASGILPDCSLAPKKLGQESLQVIRLPQTLVNDEQTSLEHRTETVNSPGG